MPPRPSYNLGMDENPYKAPARSAELKPPGKRLPVRAWLIVAIFMAFATYFAVRGTVWVCKSVRALADDATRRGSSLKFVLMDAGLAIMHLAVSVFMFWCALTFRREVRRAMERNRLTR